MTLSRAFAVLAAFLLVAAFALAVLEPSQMTLIQAFSAVDPELPYRLHRGFEHLLGSGFWANVMTPLLVRPTWLIPVALGMICLGAAASTGLLPPPRTRQRRS